MNSPATKERSATLLTGFSSYLGRRLAAQIASVERHADIYLLVPGPSVREARRYAAALPGGRGNRIHLLTGDIVDLHLGLSGQEYRELSGKLTQVFHAASVSFLGVDSKTMTRVNVEGTRNILELCRDSKQLRRLNYFSSCFVSGDREGVVAEDELSEGQRFRNVFEETKFQAELLVQRAQLELPITIYRPSTIIGDSVTGEIDRFEGPYYLAIQLAVAPLQIPIPLPPKPDAPLNVVPIDFVVSAAYALSRKAQTLGKTFHLVDPTPMSTRRVYQLLAERTQRQLRRPNVPARTTDALLRLPALERLLRPRKVAGDTVGQTVYYRPTNTLTYLEGTGIHCPSPDSYLDAIVRYLRETTRRRGEDRLEDALDQTGERTLEKTDPRHVTKP